MKTATAWTSGRTLGADRVAGAAAARCRSPPSGSTPPARSATASSSWRSSGSASTRPRSANIRERAGGDPDVMARADPRDRRRARQDAQPRDRLRRRPARDGHRGRRAATGIRRALGAADRHARLADADPAAPRGGDRPRSRSAQVAVEGTAYVCERAPWGLLPDDIPIATAIELYDVYGAGSHTRDLAPADGGTVCVLGAGHAGKLALAAARDAMDGRHGRRRRRRCRGRRPGRRGSGSATSASSPTSATRSPRSTRCARPASAPADLTVVVVNATGCEPTAILLTADARDGALLLDGDALLDRRADRRRAGRRASR